MALQLNQVEGDGTTATYFRVQQVAVYPDDQVVDVVLHGWVSEAVYAAGDDPLEEATSEPTRIPYMAEAVNGVTPVNLGITVSDKANPPLPSITEIYTALNALYPGSTIV